MEGESDEAEQQERSPGGGATSGSEASCRAALYVAAFSRYTRATIARSRSMNICGAKFSA